MSDKQTNEYPKIMYTIWEDTRFEVWQCRASVREAVIEHIAEREKYAPRVVQIYEVQRCGGDFCVYLPTGNVLMLDFTAWCAENSVDPVTGEAL